jgi:type IV pilus assembly protein PilP
MDKIIVIIRSFICFICIFSLWVGCDKKAEPPPKTRKITKKIIIDKKDASKPQLPKKTDIPKSGSKQVTAKPIAKVSPDISKGEVGDLKEKRIASVSKTTEKIETPKIDDFYNPKGKLDPFAPLIKEKPVALPVKHRKAVRRKLLTPLEKLDLSQLKLVAILRAQSGNKALVEEDSGKGYIIKKGTYIGTNAGRVTNILPDRIIVEEEVEDIYGKISVGKKEIELKPPGEE